MYNHQDWTPVVLKKKTSTPEIKVVNKNDKQQSISSVTNKPAWKIEKQIDGTDSGKPLNYVSRDNAQKVIAGRVAMKLTQKDLATKLNMQVKEIQDIENCKAIENKLVLAKIKRVLQLQ